MNLLIKLFLATIFVALPIKNSNAEEDINISKTNIIKPLINFENDRCTLCNMFVEKKQFAGALTYNNKTFPFCDIGDLIIYQSKGDYKEYKSWVHDYNSGKLLEADKSFFIITKSVRTPMGHGIIAFEKENEALDFIKSNEGKLFKDFISLSKEFTNKKGKMSNKMMNCSCNKDDKEHKHDNMMSKKNMMNSSCNKDDKEHKHDNMMSKKNMMNSSCNKDDKEHKHDKMMNSFCNNENNISDNHHGHHLGFRGQPIGVMGAHTHHKGSFMASYGLMYMGMNGNLSGTNLVSKENIFKDFMIAPENMNMFMNMIGTMYSLTDNLTIMGMFPFTSKSMNGSMNMKMENGMDMYSSSSMAVQGFGDIELEALYNIFQNESNSFIFKLGASLPTGSINKKGDMHGEKNQQYPYPMQMGSGTFDILTGLTYTSGLSDWTWGGQVNANIKLGQNANNYALGNKYNFTAWGGRRVLNWLHSFIRINFDTWGNISGKDISMNDKMSQGSRADLRAGSKLDLFAGFNFILPDLFGKNNIGLEVGLPVYQNLAGPQMANTWYLNTGIQHLF